jgi:hypothetical protein
MFKILLLSILSFLYMHSISSFYTFIVIILYFLSAFLFLLFHFSHANTAGYFQAKLNYFFIVPWEGLHIVQGKNFVVVCVNLGKFVVVFYVIL